VVFTHINDKNCSLPTVITAIHKKAKTIKGDNTHHHVAYRSIAETVVFQFFKMATICHLVFLKSLNIIG